MADELCGFFTLKNGIKFQAILSTFFHFRSKNTEDISEHTTFLLKGTCTSRRIAMDYTLQQQ